MYRIATGANTLDPLGGPSINASAFLWVNGLAGHVAVVDAFFKIAAGDSPYLFAFVCMALWLALPRGDVDTRRAIVVGVGAAAVALVSALAIGSLWYVPRPFVALGARDHLLLAHAPDASFPSRHASLAFALAFTLLRRRGWVGRVMVVAAELVAIGRVWVGVHWPMDVVGGAAVGLAASWAVWLLRAPLVSVADWWMGVFGMGPRAGRAQGGAS